MDTTSHGPQRIRITKEQQDFIESYQPQNKTINRGRQPLTPLRNIISNHLEDFIKENQKPKEYPESTLLTQRVSFNIYDKEWDKITEITKKLGIKKADIYRSIIDYAISKNNINNKDIPMKIEITQTLHNPLEFLDYLVKKLLDQGEKIHELQWFKEILEKNSPREFYAKYDDIADIIKKNSLEGNNTRIYEIDDELKSLEFDRVIVPITENVLAEVLKDMVTDKIINKDTPTNSYYPYIPEPLTDEENIMSALEDQANGDWVNIPWLNRTLNLDNEQDQSIVLGRLLNLEIQRKVKRSEISGQPHWAIINE